jgi:putative ABC transport system substrate-binding protein
MSEATLSFMLDRRVFLLSLPLGSALALDARAQQRAKVIGMLSPGDRDQIEPFHEVFLRALRDLGYVKGVDFVVVERFANGRYDQLPELAAELVKLEVDIICTGTTNGAAAAQSATTSIPIVFDSVADPVKAGFAESLAHPGRNMTGLSNFAADLVQKRIQLLQQMVPGLVRIALLRNSRNLVTSTALVMQVVEQFGLRAVIVNASTPQELEPAFQTMSSERAEAVYVQADLFLWSERRRIAELALKYKLPSMLTTAEWVEAGGLMSYGIDDAAISRQAATYVDKIFKGAKAGDLPIEQPSRFELVINRGTANALRLNIPQMLLLQAEKVI